MKYLTLIIPVVVAALMMLFQPVNANERTLREVGAGTGVQLEEVLRDANTSGVDAINFRVSGSDILGHSEFDCFPHICG